MLICINGFKMYYKNILIFFLISFISISTKAISQEINSVYQKELVLNIVDPNKSISTNVKNVEKININCDRENGLRVYCNTINGKISFSKRGRSTTKIFIPTTFFDSYPGDDISMLLDSVVELIGDTDYEMKSISGIVFIFRLTDRSFILSLGGLEINTLNN